MDRSDVLGIALLAGAVVALRIEAGKPGGARTGYDEDVPREPPPTLNRTPSSSGIPSPRHEVDTHALKVLYSERL